MQKNQQNLPFYSKMKEKHIAFSVSGGCYPYQMGIAYYIQKNFDLENIKFSGASGGSWPATLLAARMDVKVAVQHIIDIAAPLCAGKTFGAYFIYEKGMRAVYNELFKGIHVPSEVNSRLAISVTRVALNRAFLPYLKDELITDFIDNDDVISAVVASALIPFLITGSPVAIYRNWICVDAGLTNVAGIRRFHDLLLDASTPGVMLSDAAKDVECSIDDANEKYHAFQAEGTTNNSLSSLIPSSLPDALKPYGAGNLTLLAAKTLVNSMGSVLYRFVSSPEEMDSSVLSNSPYYRTLSPKTGTGMRSHVPHGQRQFYMEENSTLVLPYPYGSQASGSVTSNATNPVYHTDDAIEPSTKDEKSHKHIPSFPAIGEKVLGSEFDEGQKMNEVTMSHISEGGEINQSENASDISLSHSQTQGDSENGDAEDIDNSCINSVTSCSSDEFSFLRIRENDVTKDNIHDTSNILNTTGDTMMSVMVEDNDNMSSDGCAKNEVRSAKKGLWNKDINGNHSKFPSLPPGVADTGSYSSWISDDFSSTDYTAHSKKPVYNVQDALNYSHIDVEVATDDPDLNYSSSQTKSSFGGMITPIYTTSVNIISSFLPGASRAIGLPVANPDATNSLSEYVLSYVFNITQELKNRMVVEPSTAAIRSGSALVTYLYGTINPNTCIDKETAPSNAQDEQLYHECKLPHPTKQVSNPTSSSRSPHNMPVHHLEPFDHVVKAFDTSMYWTHKANLISQMRGENADEESCGIVMEIAPWTWRHHPLQHYHLTNDEIQLEMLFELGVHDAHYHHNEIAEFFNMQI